MSQRFPARRRTEPDAPLPARADGATGCDAIVCGVPVPDRAWRVVQNPGDRSPTLLQQASEATTEAASAEPGLVVLVRSLEQLLALQDLSPAVAPIVSVVADLEQPKELREAVAIGRGCWRDGIWLAGARITRPNERWTLAPLIKARADGYLVRNVDQLEALTPLAPCIGDFSLNSANPLSVDLSIDVAGGLEAPHRQLRPQSASVAGPCGRCGPRSARGDAASAHAPVPHGALSVLCLSVPMGTITPIAVGPVSAHRDDEDRSGAGTSPAGRSGLP